MREFTMLAKIGHSLREKGKWSEKLDGVRAIWLPETAGMIDMFDSKGIATGLWSRNGKILHVPLVQQLHDLKVRRCEGELWLGHNMFSETISAVRLQKPVKFLVFDYPNERIYERGNVRGVGNKYWTYSGPVIPEIYFNDVPNNGVIDEVKFYDDPLDVPLSDKSEGLMLRKMGKWEPRRSPLLLKFKKHSTDVVTCIGSIPGKGKFKGMIGSLIVKDKDGRVYNVGGLNNFERTINWVGTQVEVKFYERTENGIPRFPSLKR